MQLFVRDDVFSSTSGQRPGVVAACLRSMQTASYHCIVNCLLLFALLFAGNAQAAYELSQPPALLTWDGSAIPAQANVVVTRFESVQFYRYDPAGTEAAMVYDSQFASVDSLNGTPSTGANLPIPLDATGNPLTLNQTLPLSVANNFRVNEALFLIVDQPQLPASGFGTRGDGRQIMGVTLRVNDGVATTDYIVALVESSPGSNQYTGYLPTGGGISIPSGSIIEIIYDNYGEVADSNSGIAPYLVSASDIASLRAPKVAAVGGATPRSALFLAKQALRTTVAQGELAPYRLNLENNGGFAQTNIEINDTLPYGFRLRTDSVRVDGVVTTATVATNGRDITIPVASIPAGENVLIEYVTDVTPQASIGPAVNIATATSIDSGTVSNEAQAILQVENAFFNDRAVLAGRVIAGQCGDPSGKGLENVRLYLEDGSSVMTDSEGRWHLEGVKPGTHVLQLDEASLGSRYEISLCENNSRKAGNALSRFVEVQGGTLWREDFYIEEKPLVTAHIQQQLFTEVEAGAATIRLPIGNGETEFETVDVRVYLPETLTPVPGKIWLNGKPISDFVKKENYYQVTLKPKGRYWEHELTAQLTLDPNSLKAVEKTILARTTGTTAEGITHKLSSINRVMLIPAIMEESTITLRPQFEPISAELSELDLLTIEQAVAPLADYERVEFEVIGHTDSQRVVKRANRLINDNQTLSEVRAQSVADALTHYLPDNSVISLIEGRGKSEPIASNDTEAGRALNRRVELRMRTYERVEDAALGLVDGDSDLSKTGISEEHRKKAKPEPGLQNYTDGMKLNLPVISVTGTLDNRLKPKLLLNNEEVPASRLAVKMEDTENKVINYTWLGIALPETGDYELELQGIGPFGNTRFKQSLTLTRTSDLKAIRAGDFVSNVADGKTPIRVKLDLIDQSGRSIESRTELKLISGDLKPLVDEGDDTLTRFKSNVEVDAQGYAWFEPVSEAGNYQIRLASNDVESEIIQVTVDPELRDWILVGYAKGTIGHTTLEKNLDAIPDAEKDTYTDGEAAFFAKGRVKGEWLLTMAYDSRKEDGDTPLGGVFKPDQWYVLYGDNTYRQNEAASQEKLYLRLERKDFYLLFGDYDTGLTVTELSRYQRTFTGFKSEYRTRYAEANVFAANTQNAYLRKEIPGDGTSGLYRINPPASIIPGTEVITIETRDRFNNEVISSERRTRFIDYSIDYNDGSIFFREPVMVQDSNFNPITIVVEYEIETGEENVIAGGRVAVFTEDRALEVGLTTVNDGTEGQEGNLNGVDVTWRPNEQHTVKFEAANSEQDQVGAATVDGNAFLAEHTYLSEKLDTRVRIEEKADSFGLGQFSDSEDDVRQSSAEGRYRLTEKYAISGEVREQRNLENDEKRETAEARMEYSSAEWKAYAGARTANDVLASGNYRSDQLTAGATTEVLDDRLTLGIHGETIVNSDLDNADYPNRLSLDSEYRLNKVASLFAAQEFAWGNEYQAQETRAGIRATPWRGGTVVTDMTQVQDEYGPRLFSHAGLYQSLEINNFWQADFGFDRAQTLYDGTREPTFEDSARPPVSGTRLDDYTAIAVGLGYRDLSWEWTNRVENRISDNSDKWNLLSGFQHKLDSVNTLAGRFAYRDEKVKNFNENWEALLDLSWVHRPHEHRWWFLNRTRLIFDGLDDASGSYNGRRWVNNLVTNYKHNEAHQLSVMYGARYVLESISGEHYDGYSDLLSAEYRFNLTEHWDIGARASSLQSWETNIRQSSYGLMVGVSPIRDVWLSLGYNFEGFYDDDFDNANSRVAGVVLDFRIKFDQNSMKHWRGEEESSPVAH